MKFKIPILLAFLFISPAVIFSQENISTGSLPDEITPRETLTLNQQEDLLTQVNKITLSQKSAQIDEPSLQKSSPYHTNIWIDGSIITGGIGLSALGVKLIADKKGLTPAELAMKNKDQIPGFDRGNAGYYSKKADDDSYIPFQASFALPVIAALIDGKQRQKYGQVMVLYLETMAITGAMFTMSTGLIYRDRPYVYGTSAPLDKRLENDARRSFYAGHTAATAAATFFTAKVFSDFNPGSAARPYVWAAAAAVPALVGYLRYKAGMHFLSDNILGYVLGAGTGILVPELHKNKKLKDFTLLPETGKDYTGKNYKGLSITYTF